MLHRFTDVAPFTHYSSNSGHDTRLHGSGWWLELQPSHVHSRQWDEDKDEEEEGKGFAPAAFQKSSQKVSLDTFTFISLAET